jgi:hypothetical protein
MKALKKVNQVPANESRGVVQHGKITSKRLIRSRHQKIITICMVVIGIMLPINSCQKESTLPNNPQSTSMKLKALTKSERDQVAAADAAGALIGSAAGFAAGGPVGALLGAIAGGAFASVAMRHEIKRGEGAVAPVAGVSHGNLPNLDDGDDSAGNEDNPYDYVGKTHYQVMNVLLADNSLYCNTDGNFNLETCSTSIVNILPNYITMPIDEEAVSIANLQTCLDNKEKPVGNILAPMGLNPELSNILIEYENVAKESSNFNTFHEYSIVKEEAVLHSSFTSAEKQIALSYMSTLRWGTWYWEKIIED